MGSNLQNAPIRIGLFADEPLLLEGLFSIFQDRAEEARPRLLPVTGSIDELLRDPTLKYMVVYLNSTRGGIPLLESIRSDRPDVVVIVIGPEGNEEKIVESIMAGARAYLDLTASPETVRQAIDVVTSGSIWAPRRLLARLIDRLLVRTDSGFTHSSFHLTDREIQVLELILAARSNREIANLLGIEERTVKAHVGRLLRKTGVENRIELSVVALNHALVPGTGWDRRQGERRHGQRRGAGSEGSLPVIPE